MKKAIVLSAFMTIALLVKPGMVRADIEQRQNLETEVVCESGAYGSQTCRAKAKGEQEQKYVKVLGATKTHEMVDTALDAKAKLAIAGFVTVSGLAFVAIKRIAQ